jgi:hypothetical protein
VSGYFRNAERSVARTCDPLARPTLNTPPQEPLARGGAALPCGAGPNSQFKCRRPSVPSTGLHVIIQTDDFSGPRLSRWNKR